MRKKEGCFVKILNMEDALDKLQVAVKRVLEVQTIKDSDILTVIIDCSSYPITPVVELRVCLCNSPILPIRDLADHFGLDIMHEEYPNLEPFGYNHSVYVLLDGVKFQSLLSDAEYVQYFGTRGGEAEPCGKI